MRKLTKEDRAKLRAQWNADDFIAGGRLIYCLDDLDECDRELEDYDTELKDACNRNLELRRQLADLNASYKTMGEYYEAEAKASAAEAERIAALMCLGELEALRGEAEKLREVERAARILMDVTRDGDEELVKADMRALNTTLAAVDALRKKEATPND